MQFDPSSLDDLRRRHPAWRLLRYERAPLAIAFLHQAFVAQNARSIVETDALEVLDEIIESIEVDASSSRSARDYLTDWASDERGFIRRFYPVGSDHAHIAMAPGAVRAIVWLASIEDSSFVGTESRLLMAIELLRQLDIGTNPDEAVRLADLRRRRADIDAEIAQVERGDLGVLDDRAIAERFRQFVAVSRELLADFSQVEDNFRTLDRSVRERIAQWDGSKGELLQDVFGERDAIASSDQGASFRAFWDLLSAVSRQDELSGRLSRVTTLPAIIALEPDRRIRRIHHDWFNAGDHTQRMVASLTGQLRRFIDDKTWLENRRIIEIIRSIEHHAIAIRNDRPAGDFTDIASCVADINLPMERRLAASNPASAIGVADLLDDDDADLNALFSDSGLDQILLADHVDELLSGKSQVTLAEVCRQYPVTLGLAEVVGYLQLTDDRFERTVIEDHRDRIEWNVTGNEAGPDVRVVAMPRVVFVRG